MARYKGELLIVVSTICWGASYLFTKIAMRSLDGFNLVALRFTVAFLFTALIFHVAVRKSGFREIGYGAVLGTLVFGSGALIAYGLETTTISNAGFLIGAMVVFVAIFETILARQRPRGSLAAGVAFAIAGMAVLTLREGLTLYPGDVYCFFASVLLAVHVLVAGKAARNANAVAVSVMQFGFAGCLSWIAAFAAGEVVLPASWEIVAAILVLGMFGTGIGFVCQVTGQKYISPTTTAFLFTLEPIFATLFAALFMDEPLTRRVAIGGGLLLAGMYISEYR